MKLKFLFLGLIIFLESCTLDSPSVISETTKPVQQTANSITSSVQLSPPTSEKLTISATGIGEAKIGMTVGELKQKLGESSEFQVESPFMVDFDAIAIIQEGEVQYYIIYGTWETINNSSVINTLLTTNPQFRTVEGVGTGTLIKQAVSVYGQATLGYNIENESREYVNFANFPLKNINFRLYGNSKGEAFAGIYSSSEQDSSYYRTNEFREDAKIGAVMVNNTN